MEIAIISEAHLPKGRRRLPDECLGTAWAFACWSST